MPPEQALGGEATPRSRPLLAGGDAVRAGHGQAALRGRHADGGDLAAPQHAAGRAGVAHRALPARPRGPDPGAAREGARLEARVGVRGARGPRGDRPRRALALALLGQREPARRAGARRVRGPRARARAAACVPRWRVRGSRLGRDARGRAGHRQDADGPGARDLRAHARREGALGSRARVLGGPALLAVGAGGAGVPRRHARGGAAQAVRALRGRAAAHLPRPARPLPEPARAAAGDRGGPVPAVRRLRRVRALRRDRDAAGLRARRPALGGPRDAAAALAPREGDRARAHPRAGHLPRHRPRPPPSPRRRRSPS